MRDFVEPVNSSASTSIDIDSSSRPDSESTTPRSRVHHITQQSSPSNSADSTFQRSRFHHITTSVKERKPFQNEPQEDATRTSEDKRKDFHTKHHMKYGDVSGDCGEDSMNKRTILGAMEKNDSTKLNGDPTIKLVDSFETRDFSTDKKIFFLNDNEYERSSSQFKKESIDYPAGDNCIIQRKEYKFEAKEYPVKEGNRTSAPFETHNNAKAPIRSESDHEYENVEFQTRNILDKSAQGKTFSFIKDDDSDLFIPVRNSQKTDVRSEESSRQQEVFETRNRRFMSSSNHQTQEDEWRGNSGIKSLPGTRHLDASRVSVSGAAVRLVGVHESAEFLLTAPQRLNEEDVTVKITGNRHTCLVYLTH